MSGFRLLDLVKAFSSVLPEVEFPVEKISIDEKVIFTIGSGLVFVFSQLPMYGLEKDCTLKMADPFLALRPLFAMEQASLLELGVLPIVTAAFVWQLAAGARKVAVNLSYASDRELFQSAQKATSIVLGAVFAAALLASGYYDGALRGAASGDVGAGAYALIFVQVFGWNTILTLLVEVIDKGYGFGSGVLCFVALNAATRLVRDVVGMELVSATPDGVPQTYGVLAYLLKSLVTMELATIRDAAVGIFTRSGFPSIGMVLVVVASGLATIVLQNYRLELPIRSTKARGTANVYPIRMLYTGAMPVLFAFTAVANAQVVLHFAAAALQPFYPAVAALVARRDASGSLVSGAAFYLSAPASLSASVMSPIRAVVYSATVLLLAVRFSQVWGKISGTNPTDIAKQFREQGIVLSGKRDTSIATELTKVLPVAAATGAALLAALALVGELLGASGKSVSVIVGVCAAFAILEEFMMDFQSSGGSSALMSSLAKYSR